ncbi:MAG: response regulator [Gemmatimonadetes bacterium]|nr:response regulator [Gemmatimonadota bacterium]
MARFVEGGHPVALQLEGRTLHVLWAPDLPAADRQALEGMPVAGGSGSCAAAVREGRTVISADVAGDPLWAPNAAGCAARGLAACWSVPVRAPDGEMLGTFAAFFHAPRPSTPAELAVVERAATLAGIAMDRERRERLLASINKNVNEGLYRSTPDRGLVYVNHALARMFGYESPDEMLRRTTMLHYVEPGRRDELRGLIARAGHVENAEVQYCRADGTPFWGLLNATALYGPAGEVLYYDGAVSDITARRALEEQLRQAQKMEAVGKLAGGVAHDFNNLLTAITGYADEIRTGLPASHALRGDAEEVLAAAERAASLTRQLLAFSRQQVLQPSVLDLRTVVSEAGGMLRRLIGEDIGFETTFGPGAAWVRVDRGQLEQVILNLVVNARDAMPGGGVLQIATGLRVLGEAEATAQVDLAPGPYVTFTVRDSGVGMSAEVRQRAFEPFFTTKGPGKGTGLGLATVYGIVRQSGGAVALESAEGRGTTVTILFPLVAAPGAHEVAAAAPPARPRRARALIAEDEPMVRDLVRRTLARAGFEVSEAQDGVDALALARQLPGPIDLLVTDVVMPRMGGRELAAALQGERPGLRVLFMSGYATDAGPRPGPPTPDSAFLQKPFAPAGLLREVDALLATRA